MPPLISYGLTDYNGTGLLGTTLTSLLHELYRLERFTGAG